MAQAEYVNNAIRAPITDAVTKPSTNPVRAAHGAFLSALVGPPPRPVPVYASAIDIEDRAEHLGKVLGASSAYLLAILDDIAGNVPGGLDLRQVDALLADLASEVTGILQRAAGHAAWRVS